jgi:hypothetical protein
MPAPMCQVDECHRRADLASIRNGMRVYRAKCKACRQGRTPTPRPRPYRFDPKSKGWPDDQRCPFCHRRREPREGGHFLRRTCRKHRGKGLKKKSPKPPPVVIRPSRIPRPALLSRPPAPKSDPRVVSFRDMGRKHVLRIPDEDWRVFRKLFDKDTGIFPASTDKRLTRRYPTAAVVSLFSRWARGR